MRRKWKQRPPNLERASTWFFLACKRMTHRQGRLKTRRRPRDLLADTPTYTFSQTVQKIFHSVVGVVNSHHMDFWVRSTRERFSNGNRREGLRYVWHETRGQSANDLNVRFCILVDTLKAFGVLVTLILWHLLPLKWERLRCNRHHFNIAEKGGKKWCSPSLSCMSAWILLTKMLVLRAERNEFLLCNIFQPLGMSQQCLGATSRQTGQSVNISPKTLYLGNNQMMLLTRSRHVSVIFVFATDGLFGDWAGRHRGWGRHLQKQGAFSEPRCWWAHRGPSQTLVVCENHSVHRKAGQGCEPGHAGVQGKASQDEVNWEKEKGFWWTYGTLSVFLQASVYT